MTREELSARLLATFLGELEEQVRAMNADLLALEAAPADAERLKSLFRVAHTLKGAARAADVPVVEHACHALESLLAKARDGTAILAASEFQLLFQAADALQDACDRLKAGRDLADSPLERLRETLSGRKLPQPAESTERQALQPVGAGAPALEPSDGMLRIAAEKLDALLASSSQVMVAGGRAAARAREFRALHDVAARWAIDWRRTGGRLKLALEEAGAPAPLRRAADEMDEQLHHFVRDTARLASDAELDARTLALAAGDVEAGVRQLRMRPFADACEALPRAVRDLAVASGKDLRLEIGGAEVEADRAVLDALREAIVQMVRNAVDHGIEPPDARRRSGKPAQGVISVTAALVGDHLTVTVADDGAGLDAAGIRSRLAQRGVPAPRDDRELAGVLLRTALSTRDEATMLSGRGVGLDIVRAAVERIRGTVRVEWVAGRGTSFTVECPPTLATVRVVLVSVGPHLLAFPTARVQRMLRVRTEEITRVEGRQVILTVGGPVPLTSLARLLPPLVERPVDRAALVVVLGDGERRLALAVDDLVAEQEVVVQPLGKRRRLPHVSGAALLETGRLALVLNAESLLAAGVAATAAAGVSIAPVAPERPTRRHVLVVDDSITTRTLEQSVLEAAGYEVSTAADGAEAWRLLQEHGADLVVADVEMPRMDGFQLCEAIRASTRYRALPVVLLTALESAEHRARGLEIGADAYLGKSSFDQQTLLDVVEQLLT